MSPDTQPTKAMEAARKLCIELGLWGDPHFDVDQQKVAAALDAYATECIAHVFQGRGEHGWRGEGHPTATEIVPYLTVMEQRDAALAKLAEANAEDATRRYVSEFARCERAEERVRVLEAAAQLVLDANDMTKGEFHVKYGTRYDWKNLWGDRPWIKELRAALTKAATASCPYKDECDRKGEHVAPNCPPAATDEGDL